LIESSSADAGEVFSPLVSMVAFRHRMHTGGA